MIDNVCTPPIELHQSIIQPSSISVENAAAARKAMIERLIAAKMVKHEEEKATFDVYKVLYLLHHQYKKVPPEHLRVPKLSRFEEGGSPQERLAHYITNIGGPAADESYLLRYFATSLIGMAF